MLETMNGISHRKLVSFKSMFRIVPTVRQFEMPIFAHVTAKRQLCLYKPVYFSNRWRDRNTYSTFSACFLQKWQMAHLCQFSFFNFVFLSYLNCSSNDYGPWNVEKPRSFVFQKLQREYWGAYSTEKILKVFELKVGWTRGAKLGLTHNYHPFYKSKKKWNAI